MSNIIVRGTSVSIALATDSICEYLIGPAGRFTLTSATDHYHFIILSRRQGRVFTGNASIATRFCVPIERQPSNDVITGLSRRPSEADA